MGMFDNITVKYRLPKPANCGELKNEDFSMDFQTKDLDNAMNHFEVRKTGCLWVEIIDGTWGEPDESAKSLWDRLPKFTETKRYWRRVLDVNWPVSFYNFVSKDEYENDYWIEYQGGFFNGKLQNVKLIKFEVTPNAERKEREAKFAAAAAKRAVLWNKWYIKYGYEYYWRFVRWAFRNYRRIKNKLPNDYKIERFLTPL